MTGGNLACTQYIYTSDFVSSMVVQQVKNLPAMQETRV